jgi:DNA (cytosine-5)-methyltransferase 1
MTLKILNLYAGIGGNRKLWTGDIEVTAVELDPKIAAIYKDFFPQDTVIIADAHAYLLEHYKEFDFIWSSPPCPTHSRLNFCNGGRWKIEYPDMKLYQEIIFLKHWFKGIFVIENVISYYEPLIKPQECGRHYFWSNFKITELEYKKQIGKSVKQCIREAQIPELTKLHKIDLCKYKIHNKRRLLRNCVIPELGKHIFNCAFKEKQVILSEVKE